MNKKRQLIIGAYISYSSGHHPASWRYIKSNKIQDINKYYYLSKLSELGLIDFIFLADTPSIFPDDKGMGYSSRVTLFEPLTLLSSLASITTNIGLIGTSSTTYQYPFNIAREYASLDHISKGRAGWNLVTSSKNNAAGNFGINTHLEHKKRYIKAEECWEIVTRLWDSWEDHAFIKDYTKGIFYLPKKCHPINFSGKYIQVSNAILNIARPPQGYPIIVQAGSSELGITLAAKAAEIVFTAQPNINLAKIFYKKLKQKINKYHRYFKDILILPGLSFYIDKSEKKAWAKFYDLQNKVPPTLGINMLENLLGGEVNLNEYDIDKPLPKIPTSNSNQSRKKIIENIALENNLSIKELYKKIIVSRGHLNLIGSYDQVTNIIKEWFCSGACDGFNIMPPTLPESLEKFITHIIPRLQKLGIYKKKYKQGTLREKLSIPKPPNKNIL